MGFVLFFIGLAISMIAGFRFVFRHRPHLGDLFIGGLVMLLPFVIGPFSILTGTLLLVAARGLRED